jgi:predicted AlkP superfamily pyrophosphatase or phosphodiesterase
MRRLVAFALLAILAGLSSCRTASRVPATEQILILLSIDGFRWDYLDRYEAPTLRGLADDGVRARRMTPAFPTKTFPNHYTLVTGLRPETHGIVANWFWDPALGEMFGMARKESEWWSQGEPVWVTAEKQGVRAACFFWPGSETEIQGIRPSLYRVFDKRLTNPQRVDGMLAWLDVPEAERPKFLTLYFDSVDTTGHTYGPEAPETRAAVKEADDAVARLMAGLEERGLRGRTNIVVVADHGMSECGPDKVIFFEDLMDVNEVQIESNGPNGGVRPKPGTVSPRELVEQIRRRAPPQLKAYLREEVPAHLHYRNNDRIPPVVLICDDHWNLESKTGWPARRATYPRGTHGWDPANENMGAIFIASGPAFARGKRIGIVDSLDVYNLLCSILQITPAKNEGDQNLIRAALVSARRR